MEYRRFSSSHYPARNALDIARDAFMSLVTGPRPLSLDGRSSPGLPDRCLPLDEVRDRLLVRDCPGDTRDAVWAQLVHRSRTQGAAWTVGCVGVALPALTSVAAELTARFAGDPSDVHAEVLAGFLAELASLDPDRPKIMVRLRWAAYRSGHVAVREALDGPTPVAPGFRSSLPAPPWGHPDLVLARAVAEGVLTPTEAEVIGSTRLEDLTIGDWAADHRLDYWTAYRVRERAESRLAAYLRDEATDTDPDNPLTAEVATALTLQAATTSPSASQPQAVNEQRSRSVSGRLRNGATPRPEKSEQAVFKNGPKSGVQGCGGSTPTAPSPQGAPALEVPPCA